MRTPYSREKSKVGFERLLANKAIEAAYPLHSVMAQGRMLLRLLRITCVCREVVMFQKMRNKTRDR